MIYKKVYRFFDKLEDKVRARLSRHPIVYSLIGGVAIVLFWRGVWITADEFAFMTGPVSIAISIGLLLLTGLFASFFVGDQIILSGLKQEKKITDKTETEVQAEMTTLTEVKEELQKIENVLEEIKSETAAHASEHKKVLKTDGTNDTELKRQTKAEF